jgi:hypothetical protein
MQCPSEPSVGSYHAAIGSSCPALDGQATRREGSQYEHKELDILHCSALSLFLKQLLDHSIAPVLFCSQDPFVLEPRLPNNLASRLHNPPKRQKTELPPVVRS